MQTRGLRVLHRAVLPFVENVFKHYKLACWVEIRDANN